MNKRSNSTTPAASAKRAGKKPSRPKSSTRGTPARAELQPVLRRKKAAPPAASPTPAHLRKASDLTRETGRRLSPEARRAQIIGVAEEIFSTHPYAEFGVPEVARALGITPGLVYHYFPSKEALLVAAVEQRARELLAFCAPDTSRPFLEQIQLGIKGYLDYVEAHSLAYRNLFRGPSANEPDVLRICESTRLAIIAHYMGGLGLGSEPMPALRLSLRAYFGFSETAILQWLESPLLPRQTIERMCRRLVLAAFRAGLENEPGSPFSAQQLALLEQAYLEHFSPP